MKILIICEFFPTGKDLKFSGGVEARTYFVSKHLAQNHRVHIITTKLPGTKNHELINRINIHRVGPVKNYRTGANLTEIYSLIKFISAAVKIGKEINPDIVEGTNFITHLIAGKVSSAVKAPLVYWYPDVFIGSWIKTYGLISGLIGEILERINLLGSPNKFIAISNSTKNKLIRNNIQSVKISVINCGVDAQEFDFSQPKFKNPTIICISRLVAYKKIDNLIWAFAVLRKKIPNLKLMIVGTGPEENKLKKIVSMLKINKSVSFFKNLPRFELVKFIKSSHILCLPSEVEGFGICIIEAAASKIPYVISDIPVLKEISKNGRGGLMFKTGSVLDLSKKIESLLISKSLYDQKRQEAFMLSKSYSWTDISKKTENVYKSLVK